MSQQTEQRVSFSFENTENAFKSKSNRELDKAFWLFKIIGSPFLTKLGLPLTSAALKIGLPITPIIRNTIFNHFCGGESIKDCLPLIDRLAAQHVGTILEYSVEGDDDEVAYERTCAEILRTVRHAAENHNVSFSVF